MKSEKQQHQDSLDLVDWPTSLNIFIYICMFIQYAYVKEIDNWDFYTSMYIFMTDCKDCNSKAFQWNSARADILHGKEFKLSCIYCVVSSVQVLHGPWKYLEKIHGLEILEFMKISEKMLEIKQIESLF